MIYKWFLIYEEIEEEIKGFFVTDNLNTEAKQDKVLNWWNFNKSKYSHLASFARTAPLFSVYSK